MDPWLPLQQSIRTCRLCPRLVAHREAVAQDPPRRFRGERYWARPIPGFGDPEASVAMVGLAPAAHGGNRTGRMFTGDQSGAWLFRALFEEGFASQPESVSAEDGLRLEGAFVTAVVRCAPPDNKPSPLETGRCLPYLLEELRLLPRLRVVVALGGFAWAGYLRSRRLARAPLPSPLPRFGHGQSHVFAEGTVLLGCYHPSQQNTFTGRLTRPMLRGLFARASRLARQA